MKQSLLDLGTTSPRTLSATNMSSALASELLTTISLGDFALTPWQDQFVADTLSLKTFTLGQREVIYNMAFKFRIL